MEIPSRQDALCLPPGDRPAILCGEEGLFRYDRRIKLPDLFLPYDLIAPLQESYWTKFRYYGPLTEIQLTRLSYGQRVHYGMRDEYRFSIDLYSIHLDTQFCDQPLKGVCWPDAMDVLCARLHRIERQNELSY